MKKSIFISKTSVVLVAVMIFGLIITGCSNSAGGGNPSDNSNGGAITRQEVSGKIGKYVAPYEVGDIVFNDGSATPYADFSVLTTTEKNTKKTSAIALIFYKGTGLNSDVNGTPNTTTSRTLGVGLKHNKTGLAWAADSTNGTQNAHAHGINITTIQCTPTGSSGSYTFTGDKNGSDNLEQIGEFPGVSDTGTSEKYPAFYFGKNYKDISGSQVSGTSYESGWYLPSIAELYQIYANGKGASNVFDIDEASYALGGNKFENSVYWSSSQYYTNTTSDSNAYHFDNNSGLVSFAFKDRAGTSMSSSIIHCVCAIREFN